jgi:hypothetical protein
MGRILDISGKMPNSDKLWYGVREAVWQGTRLEFRWVNHQVNEDTPTNGIGTCLHWTADRRTVIYNDYMVNCILGADGKPYLVKTVRWDQRQAHLWKRNSLIDGWTICADPTVPGREPTKEMVELLAQWNAEYCKWKHIDPRAQITVPEMACDAQAENAWYTGKDIQVPSVFHHSGYAKRDGYASFRWDCDWVLPGTGGKTVFQYYVERTLAIYDELGGKPMPDGTHRQFEFVEALKT